MSLIQNDSQTPPDDEFAVSGPFSSGGMDPATKPVKASADVLLDYRLHPTAGLEAAAEYVRTTDGRQMLATLEQFIRNNPGVSVTVAAAFGFVVGRSIGRE